MTEMLTTLEPYRIAEDTFVIPQAGEAPGMGYIYLNSMVILGREPVIVDTGAAAGREAWLRAVWSLLDPKDVQWIFLSHDDSDHTGNLLPVLHAAPQARLVTNALTIERLSADYRLPLERCLWVNDGERFDVGDRALVAVRPPVYDSPTTRGLLDPKTGVYWGSDCFSATVPFLTQDAADIPADEYRERFLMTQRMISPWHEWLDEARYGRVVSRLASLPIRTIATGHGAPVYGAMVPAVFDLLRELPTAEPAPLPTQRDLEAILAAMTAEAAAGRTLTGRPNTQER